jgi:hypothetical protein
MENGVPIRSDMPGQTFDFEDVTSLFEKAAAGMLATLALCFDIR